MRRIAATGERSRMKKASLLHKAVDAKVDILYVLTAALGFKDARRGA